MFFLKKTKPFMCDFIRFLVGGCERVFPSKHMFPVAKLHTNNLKYGSGCSLFEKGTLALASLLIIPALRERDYTRTGNRYYVTRVRPFQRESGSPVGGALFRRSCPYS